MLLLSMSSKLSIYLMVPAILLWFIYKYLVTPLCLSPLSRIPPIHPTAPISSLWIRHHRRGGRVAFRLLSRAHKKHGPVIRLGPRELSVASLDGLRTIYLGGFEKDDWYLEEFMNYNTPNLVSMLASKPHSVQKRMLSHVYSKSYIQHSPDLARLSQVILARWARLLNNRGDLIIPVLGWNRALGSDFTSAYLFGCENGTDFLRDSEESKTFFESWTRRMKGLAEVDKAKKEVEAYLMKLVRRTERSIQTPREARIDSKPVVYEQFSKALDKSGLPSSEKKDLIIASEMADHFLAGTETSKVTLTYLQYELSRRPALQRALRDELLTLSPSYGFSIPTSQHQYQQPLPNPKALDDLPLLDAVLKEALRLYTPSPPLLKRIVPKGGTVIDGYAIPGATIVGTTGHAMHMNEAIFPDAQSFKPERWLADGPRKTEMLRWFWPFGSGGRMCIGSHFAIYSKLSP